MELLQQLQAALGDAYRIERELKGGGMARVVVAMDVALGRRVVIKLLSPELAASVSSRRFARRSIRTCTARRFVSRPRVGRSARKPRGNRRSAVSAVSPKRRLGAVPRLAA